MGPPTGDRNGADGALSLKDRDGGDGTSPWRSGRGRWALPLEPGTGSMAPLPEDRDGSVGHSPWRPEQDDWPLFAESYRPKLPGKILTRTTPRERKASPLKPRRGRMLAQDVE
jgi:hypothetical protein